MIFNNTEIFNKIQQFKYLAKTNIAVDIKNLGTNTKCIAVPEKTSIKQIYPGIWFKKESRRFSKDNFTNVYDVFWDSKRVTLQPEIYSSSKSYLLGDQIESDPNIMAVINGGFFFLTDICDRTPLDLPYNLCIRDGKILGLPSSDDPIVYIQEGKIHAQKTKARGVILIGNKIVKWVGKNSRSTKKDSNAILFNSKSSDIMKVRDANNIQIGILDSKNITTPKDAQVTDIVVRNDKKNNLVISHINKGGGTHFFDGLFILQIKNCPAFKKGTKVTPLLLDGLDLQKMPSAITIGKEAHDTFFWEKSRIDRRDARSLIAEDINNNIHFITFDGSKYVPGFKGVSAKDISSYFSPRKFHWAFFLDGGGSTRIIVRENNKLNYLANEFAFRKLDDGSLLWDWQHARQIASSILLRVTSV